MIFEGKEEDEGRGQRGESDLAVLAKYDSSLLMLLLLDVANFTPKKTKKITLPSLPHI